MKVRKFPLLLSLLCSLMGLLALVPVVFPESLSKWVPFYGDLERVLGYLILHAVPTIVGNHLVPYVVPLVLGVWAVFFVITINRPFFWWMVPYSALILYTVFLFSQLLVGATIPQALLVRLSREHTMGLLLLILSFLLELTVFILLAIVSVRFNRMYREKYVYPGESNRKAKRSKKPGKHERNRDEEEATVIINRNEQREDRTPGMTYSSDNDGSQSSVDEVPMTFPKIKQLPKLKTIGKREPADDGLYVGSVKVTKDDSVVLADTPVEDIDEPQEVPAGKKYDPIPSLRRQMAEDAMTDPMVVPSSIPRKATRRVEPKATEPPQVSPEVENPVFVSDPTPTKIPGPPVPATKVSQIVTEEMEDLDDMEVVSGIGGLLSSNEGASALLTRNKLKYNYPSEDLLDTYPDHVTDIDESTREAGENLILTLKQFKIEATLMNIVKGPTVTMFEVSPAPGVRVSSIVSLSDNIALQLAARQVRIVAPIPGKQAVGIEVPNKKRSIIGFKDLLPTIDAKGYQVPMILGRKITGEPVVIEITQTPHLLIAGATGSGKSVCVNSLISSILYRRSPKEVRLILVDPKIVELRVYNGIPHLLTPVITEPRKTIKALEFCLYEMDRRYKLLNALAVRNITAYNKKILDLKLARERLPYIVVVIDEFADLMTTVGKELETLLARLAAMARAVGIHLVLATQRPSANVITGIIKSNIPTRIAFMVASQIDSRIIIDETGAEKLLGRGDMLFAPGWDPNSVRIQGAFLSDEEVERIVEYAKTQGEPDYLDEAFFEEDDTSSDDGDDDDSIDSGSDEALMEKALKIVVERQSASASYLQRRLKIGYNRAARLVEQMEDDGLVGPARGSKPRELLKFPD
ncbi:MAG: hypothetical protein A2Y31_08960 [Spirochaetes bacterium GWC2_52_13]|nr:MAG: hypothetical protein A2Y31_08960 [Spirochaetes bacterium GWC2_52_13]